MSSPSSPSSWMQRAVELSMRAVESGTGGPFGAVIVRGETLVASGYNQVIAHADPTAHAEVVAIRAACRVLGEFRLEGCALYSSCEPCPMCLGAIYWARIERVYFTNTRAQAAAIGFDDALIYQELSLPADERQVVLERVDVPNAFAPMAAWQALRTKQSY